jgi:hypothetical protein
MSASHEWSEWHLTPRGWERGSWKTDFGSIHHEDPPPDRVLTCKYHEKVSSSFSQIRKYVEELWRLDYESRIKELIDKFGECPESL